MLPRASLGVSFLLAVAALVLADAPTRADDAPRPAQPEAAAMDAPNQFTIGAGLLSQPAFIGAAGNRLRPMLVIDGQYEDRLFISSGEGLGDEGIGVKVIRIDGFSAGPEAQLRFGRKEKDSSHQLQGLGNIGGAVEVGGFIAYAAGPFEARLVSGSDISGSHQGTVITGSLSLTVPVWSAFLDLTPKVSWASGQFNRTYFGINATQSARSGRPQFQPGAGWENAEFETTLTYPIDDRWAVAGLASYMRLLGPAADSPIVKTGGSVNQLTAGLFLSYRLY